MVGVDNGNGASGGLGGLGGSAAIHSSLFSAICLCCLINQLTGVLQITFFQNFQVSYTAFLSSVLNRLLSLSPKESLGQLGP